MQSLGLDWRVRLLRAVSRAAGASNLRLSSNKWAVCLIVVLGFDLLDPPLDVQPPLIHQLLDPRMDTMTSHLILPFDKHIGVAVGVTFVPFEECYCFCLASGPALVSIVSALRRRLPHL